MVDVLQVCVTFFNMYEQYSKTVYELKDHHGENRAEALNKIREWDYNADSPIALGMFYHQARPVLGERFLKPETKPMDREDQIKRMLKET